MDLTLSPRERDLQERAGCFAREHLFPNEMSIEEHNTLPSDIFSRLKGEVLAAGFNAINHTSEHGGQGLSLFEQALVNEQFGMATGGIWGVAYQPAIPLKEGNAEQRRRYLEPCCRGERTYCFAISEANAGSDPRQVKTTAVRRGNRYYLSGEKWFVTHGDIADFIMVHAHVDGDPAKPTVFLVDKDRPGVRIKRVPKFMHTYISEHPEFVFEEVELGDEDILGTIGGGLDLTKDWFVETRLKIAAHCVGAATRATEIANAYAAERVQFGRLIRDFQAIEFMLADMAVEIMSAKSLVYRVAWQASQRSDRKLAHAHASAVKLQASEMAGRVIDKALQILGGRGYMRENPVERLYRDVRVDRIWEGSSEIQRVVIGSQIRKRGLATYTGWID
ncbi:acyl-CoA dehydrogenase family protein [Bradyrhizobium sp. SSUT18]|uniref:acyl-CoA dehydrogenase family protein n=1 Tax=Bradyrhizobium sp. SSUT18 TaxID=3040602 RepID=UPI0024477899|nr:acyl-CoA dehydrogenase family protein [Bradyrhizobium sp. SSUT18]MDH2405278.1 acyl-CoA dehydrogenase family protein [Bradyrhizobium sp. SSUT18]